MTVKRIQLRRGSAAQWTSSNPILSSGEIGLELDTKNFKIGDGITYWNNLDYVINPITIAEIQDVIAQDPDDGSLLIYNSSINKWEASIDLEKQNVDGGFF